MSTKSLIFPVLFFATVLAVRAWFASGSEKEVERLHFRVRDELPGWKFEPEKVADRAQEILATTNLFNGNYYSTNGQRITTFVAEWRAESSEAMSVVQHTPDICWVGAGMKPANLGQPERVEIELGGRSIPFECRVFGPPQGSNQELVLWCTLVGGAILPETGRWAVEDGMRLQGRSAAFWAGRRVATGQFFDNVTKRRRGVGEKQFVRFSALVDGGWQSTLERLESFAPAWIELRNQ